MKRETRLKSAAFTGGRLHADVAVVQLHDAAAERKSDAIPFGGCPDAVAAIKWVENHFLLFQVNSRAVIAERNIN